MTEIAQEDKDVIDKFFDKLENLATTGGEVSLTKIGDCISKMPTEDLHHLGGLIKKYGYYGAFFAIQQSITEHDLGPIGQYALATGISVLLIPSSLGILSTTLIAVGISELVRLSWDYIEENKDDIFDKIKEMFATKGIEIDENQNISFNLGITQEVCPIPVNEEQICLISETLSVAETSRSPLVLDLDGDGVETTGVENGTHFDHDGNDFAEKSGWVGSDDGLLVRDVNGNGVIDDGTELFGNNSVLSSGETAKNGFEALKDLDSNNDGVFNSSDTEWNNVKVWKDANGNGMVDEGELLSLEQAGVAGINVDYEASTTVDASGNEHKQTGTFIKTDGTTGSVHDVWFETDTTDTVDLSNVEIPADTR